MSNATISVTKEVVFEIDWVIKLIFEIGPTRIRTGASYIEDEAKKYASRVS